MRQFGTVLALGLLAVLAAGCNSTRWNWTRPAEQSGTKAPVGAPPSVASLVEYLNVNSSRVKTLRVDDLTVTAHPGGFSPSFTTNGTLVCEKPRGFRMGLNHLSGQVVDLGSNNDEFWYWISKANPPYQFYCGYRDLEQGVKFMPIPFQPDWVMETLGIGQYGPAERYQLDASDPRTLRLIERARSPQGQPVRKVIVMQRTETRAPNPQVTHYLLIDDATNKEICSAHITETMLHGDPPAILPRKLDLYWRQENAKMSMVLHGTQVNGQVPAAAFVRQPMQGVPSFNLARMQVDNGTVQRVQGVAPNGLR